MARLMITCPTTGQDVFTGIEIASDTIAQIPDIVARMLCPACNQEHAWSKKDARAHEPGDSGASPSGE
jgi:hypothetical protein